VLFRPTASAQLVPTRLKPKAQEPLPSPLSGPLVVCKHWDSADFASDRRNGKASGKIKVPKTEVPGYGSFVLCIYAGDNTFYLGDSKEGAH
jgi:predicted enzyme related to lactoylglutathione lyase